MNTCKQHRRYQAIRKPRVACEDCWRLWFYKLARDRHKAWEEEQKKKYGTNPDGSIYNKYDDPNSCWYG